MSYLLGITIGPVQSYIQESRKLRDLYNSSKIISDIMKYIHNYVYDKAENAEVIYPNHGKIQDVDYSNYMIFQIDEPINLKNLEVQICKSIYSNIEICSDNDLDFNYKDAIKESFHLFWAIERIENDKYSIAYKKVTKLIRDLKNTYEFDQYEQKSGKKCLICGKRNIITNKLENKIRKEFLLNVDEDLCSTCLLKRNYKKSESENIASLYSIATEHWRNRYNEKITNLSERLNELFNEIDKYYNPNEIDKIFKALKYSKNGKQNSDKSQKKLQDDLKVDLSKTEEKLKKIKEIMNDLYVESDKESRVKLPNYEYSFIQFDIDNLGCWMSGKYLEDKDNLKRYQKKISNVLINFSQRLREVLENKCCIIYSGGDDFLGVLTSENILEVIEIIDREFKSKVEQNLFEYMTYDNKITYSTSVTIAQCKDQMSYALSKTRLELEKAKDRYKKSNIEKNGVAINYIINNGKEITCYLKRDRLENYFKIIREYKSVESNLSFSFINNFADEVAKFKCDDLSFEEASSFNHIMNYEFKRLVLRSKVKKDNEENFKIYLKKLLEFLKDTINENNNETKPNNVTIDFKNLINMLKIYQKLCTDNLRLVEYREGERDEF